MVASIKVTQKSWNGANTLTIFIKKESLKILQNIKISLMRPMS